MDLSGPVIDVKLKERKKEKRSSSHIGCLVRTFNPVLMKVLISGNENWCQFSAGR